MFASKFNTLLCAKSSVWFCISELTKKHHMLCFKIFPPSSA